MVVRVFDGPPINEREAGIFYDHMKHIIVRIRVPSGNNVWTATGCLILGGKYILTACHIFDEHYHGEPVSFWPWSERILNSCPAEEAVLAHLIHGDVLVDLALLKVDSKSSNLDYGMIEYGPLPMWSGVHCISMANDQKFCYHYGRISQTSTRAQDFRLPSLESPIDDDTKVLEVKGMSYEDTKGRSGAPILNEKGMIIGIVVISCWTVLYAITAEEIRKFLHKFLDTDSFGFTVSVSHCSPKSQMEDPLPLGQYYKNLQPMVVRLFTTKTLPSWRSLGGVLVGSANYVLTHGILQQLAEIHVQIKHNEELFMFSAFRFHYFEDLHLVLFRIDKTKHFRKLESASIGDGVVTDQLVHTLGYNFGYTTCRVSSAERVLRSVMGKRAKDSGLLLERHANLRFIQCSNGRCHQPGDPIFDNTGKLLGILIFNNSGEGHYVNLTDCKVKKVITKISKKQKQGESSQRRRR